MRSEPVYQQNSYQNLRQVTILPQVKLLQDNPRVRPNLPSIRQLLQDIRTHNSDHGAITMDSMRVNMETSQVSNSHTNLCQVPFVIKKSSRREGLNRSPAVCSVAPHSARQYGDPRMVRFQPCRSAPRPPKRVGEIQKPSDDLLKLANLVEASPRMEKPSLTGNSTFDRIISLNGDYQLKLAGVLESLQTVYRHLQEWPLSVHSQDIPNGGEMHILTDFIPSDSLELTISMVKQTHDSLKAIKQWKLQHKRARITTNLQTTRDTIPRKGTAFVCTSEIGSTTEPKTSMSRQGTNPSNYTVLEKAPVGHNSNPNEISVSVPDTEKKNVMAYNHAPLTTKTRIGSKIRSPRSSLQCAHCASTKTPEWRKGPYGKRSLCNACGLFYKKLLHKFGFDQAAMIMKYRKSIFSKDRKVPRSFDVPSTHNQSHS